MKILKKLRELAGGDTVLDMPWKKAVKDLKMTWPQACDFQVWYGPVARKYNLSAVPYTVLINPEGRIEALNLRGEELINTIKTLLKNDKKK